MNVTRYLVCVSVAAVSTPSVHTRVTVTRVYDVIFALVSVKVRLSLSVCLSVSLCVAGSLLCV